MYVYSARTAIYRTSKVHMLVDWTGEGAALETRDSLYLALDLVSNREGATGAVFRAPRRPDGKFVAAGSSTTEVAIAIDGVWEAGELRGRLRNELIAGDWFEGQVTCTRQ